MKTWKNILIIAFLCLPFMVSAQELNCNVQVNTSQVQGSDKSIFDAMQKAVFEFMNSRKWTNNQFKNTERIECTILINITEQISVNDFKGTLQVQSRRPVYNTSYFSTVMNHLDKEFQFKFNEFDPLVYSENSFESNLTQVLAFYANMIIAMDYDSFSPKGGQKYFLKAQQIVSNAQGAQESGWKAFESERNRYWMVENLLHQNYVPLRECMYEYHRQGFDILSNKLPEGRAAILNSLRKLESVFERKPGSFSLQIFFNAKSSEIVELYKEGLPKERTEVANLLSKIDPNNLSKYDQLAKGK